jgi:uncharacterized membrane protein
MKINLYFLGICLVSLFFLDMSETPGTMRNVLFLLGLIVGVVIMELVKFIGANKKKTKE